MYLLCVRFSILQTSQFKQMSQGGLSPHDLWVSFKLKPPHLSTSVSIVFVCLRFVEHLSTHYIIYVILCGLAEAWNSTLANGLRAFFWPFSTLASAAAQSVVQAICPEVILIAFRSRNAFKPKAPIEFGPTLCDRQLTTIALARTKRIGVIHHVISIWHCAAKLQKLAKKFFHPFLLLHGLTLEVVTIRPNWSTM